MSYSKRFDSKFELVLFTKMEYMVRMVLLMNLQKKNIVITDSNPSWKEECHIQKALYSFSLNFFSI